MSKRIPQSFINELLARTDIVCLIERYLPLKKSGSNYSCLCPFHQEKSPSFSVSAAKQFYYCFGCGASGNAISFVMNYERLSFIEAIESLAAQSNMTIPKEYQVKSEQADHDLLYEVMEKTEQFYRIQLSRHSSAEKAQQYLAQRGLSAEIIKQFGLGYAPAGWDNLLKSSGNNPQAIPLLLKLGLVVENESGKRYDRFRDRVMFPIRDRRGRIIGFGGRVLDDSTPKYLNSPETVIFHKGQELYGLYEARQAVRDLRQLIVVEGYMDVIALAQAGIHYAVATLGTAVTAQHVQRLMRSCQQIVFCFDGDLAGQKAAWKALEESFSLLSDQIELRFSFMPKGQDPDSYVREKGKAAFLSLIDEAKSMSDFFFSHLSDDINMETLAGRAQLVAQAMPYLQKMTAVVTKELMINELATLSHTPIEQLRVWTETTPSMNHRVLKQSQQKSNKKTPMRLMMTLLLQYPHLIANVSVLLPEGDLPGLSLLKELWQLLKTNPELKTGAILEYWRDRPEFNMLSTLATQETLIPESGVEAELIALVHRLHKELADQAAERLMQKAITEGLSLSEKQELQRLVRLQHVKT